MPEKVSAADVSDAEFDEINENYCNGELGNIEDGTVWDIPLNEKACWEDGTKITADDYIESMELQLNPKYANFRADSYYSGNFVLANAENYYKQGRQTIVRLVMEKERPRYMRGLFFLTRLSRDL